MNNKILIILLAVLCFGMLSSTQIQYNRVDFQENTILVCFDKNFISNDAGLLDFRIENNIVFTGNSEFDNISKQYEIVNLEQMIDFVTHKEWNNNGQYIQNIYRVFLKNDTKIEEARTILEKSSMVLYAEYEGINRSTFTPNDPMFDDQWHLPKIQSPECWDWTQGSTDVLIAIVDSGVQWTHEDLRDNIWVNDAELNSTSGGNPMTINWDAGTVSGGNGIDDDGNGQIDDCVGWNFYNDTNHSNQYTSGNDHGTHVAGCAVAVGNNGIGVSGVAAVGQILVSSHRGSTPGDNIINGYDGVMYAAQTGAHIINCSWGGPGNGSTANNIVNYAYNLGSLVVAAAGNDDWSNDAHPSYPNDCDNALCVAATDPSDLKASFSNWGSTIDISSPGTAIKSTVINGYDSYQGTSMASPIVAGAASLVLSTHPEFGPLELKNRLEMTADLIDEINPDYAGFLGTGRVNAFQAAMYDLIPKITIEDFSFSEQDGDGDGVPNPGETCKLTINLMNNWFDYGLWAQADDVVITLSTENPDVTIVSGTETVNAGTIYQAGTYCNSDSPFLIETNSDVSIQEIALNVNIQANPTLAYPYNVDHEIIVELQLEQHGWPFVLGGATSSASAISDIDGDSDKEVIFGDINGGLHVVNPDGTEDAGFPLDLSGNISTAVALGDLDNDGHEEIIAINNAGNIYAIDYLGNNYFDPYISGCQIKSNAMINDIDNDGSLEIIVVTFIPQTKVIILNSDGTDYPGFPVILEDGRVLSSAALGDLDGDNYPEVIAASLSGNIYAVSTATGANIAGWPVAAGVNSWHGPNLADIDNDNELEVIAPLSNGVVYVYNADGSLLFNYTADSPIKTSAVTADINSDNSIEIIFGATSGSLYVLNSDGSNFPGFPMDIGAGIECTAGLVDMDNNGTFDMVFGDNNGVLHSVDITGSETNNFPYYIGSPLKVAPSIDDIDGDEDIDIVIANQYAYHVIDYKQIIPTENIIWSSFKYNNFRTGNAMSPQNGVEDNDLIPEIITSLGANYPNPFNPTTKISFSLKTDDNIKLEIFNIKGQLVKTLVDGNQTQGYHIVEWNGKNNNNHKAGSGIYLYKLQTSNYISTLSLIHI